MRAHFGNSEAQGRLRLLANDLGVVIAVTLDLVHPFVGRTGVGDGPMRMRYSFFLFTVVGTMWT